MVATEERKNLRLTLRDAGALSEVRIEHHRSRARPPVGRLVPWLKPTRNRDGDAATCHYTWTVRYASQLALKLIAKLCHLTMVAANP